MKRYVIGIDQSTQGTKALLFDEKGTLTARQDAPHMQHISAQGHVSHDLEEIYRNVRDVTERLISRAEILPEEVACIGISNQRETVGVWDRKTGHPLEMAIVWQCARAQEQCERVRTAENEEMIRSRTGIPLSPYFGAAKIAWYLENRPEIRKAAEAGEACFGTVDSYLLYRLTKGACFATDYSNASRTQLFDIDRLCWDEEICGLFGIRTAWLPRVQDSDSLFGMTTMEGLFPDPVPVHAMLGDSHGALFGQNCRRAGMLKATYGTGSSIMLHTGERRITSRHGLVTSLAWGRRGHVEYVLEGNINYTGAVISWLQKDVGLFENPAESDELARQANPEDRCCLVPAFSGLGAPYWSSNARASLRNMSRSTGRAEIVRAGLDCIAWQIADVLEAMREDAQMEIRELRVDGGPTRNTYLMQFQSDAADLDVQAADTEELSAIGAACMAGLAAGFYEEKDLEGRITYTGYRPHMDAKERKNRQADWKAAVRDTCREAKEV